MKGSRTLNTFAVLAMAADEALLHAQADDDGSFYDSLLCIVAAVFALEAFLNHVGEEVSAQWTNEEQSLSIKEKLRSVASVTNTKVDFDSTEYQRITRAIGFRDFWAHGKAATVSRQFSERKHERSVRALESEWERMCNPTDASNVKAAVEAVIRRLWKAAGHDNNPFAVIARASGSR